MQEHQITVEGETFVLEQPFHVLATANPIEYEGTYPLPEAQLDRFMMRTSFGYPSVDDEWDVLQRRIDRQREDQSLRQITDAATLIAMPHVLMGSSPRGALGLMLAARAYAVIDSRDYVTPEDVKEVAEPVLAHRITVKPEMWMSQVTGRTVVATVLASVPAPAPLEPTSGQP
jgi:MoxR-like ATPase